MSWSEICRNWKTSGAAFIGAVAGIFVLFFPSNTEYINRVAEAIVLLCGAAIGLFARDADKGGTASNPVP